MTPIPQNYDEWAAEPVPEIGSTAKTPLPLPAFDARCVLRRSTAEESQLSKCPRCGLHYAYVGSHEICGCETLPARPLSVRSASDPPTGYRLIALGGRLVCEQVTTPERGPFKKARSAMKPILKGSPVTERASLLLSWPQSLFRWAAFVGFVALVVRLLYCSTR